MQRKWLLRFLLFAGLAVVAGASQAQAQTDVALSLYGAFHGTTNGNGTIQSPANSAGGMIELRHISNPLVGYEATYSYNRGNQVYSSACAGITCTAIEPVGVSANAHQISGAWVASVHIANLRPFGLAGVGLLLESADGRPEQHFQLHEAGVPVRCGPRLGPIPAHRIAVSISREPLQGTESDAALHIDRRVYAHV